MQVISGQIVDIRQKRIYPGDLYLEHGKILKINPTEQAPPRFILPGFIDAHVHIESSMLVPVDFARLAVIHGTVATVSDPHEIANVLGIAGVNYMIDNAALCPFKFYFGAPSCVPATGFETSGAVINTKDVSALLARKEIKYLAEMMNWPGVLHHDQDVLGKIKAAQNAGKPVDGHAPGLKGAEAVAYASAGISTDHECFTMEEALDKLNAGMKILIREGSAAKNFEALADLLHEHANNMMFCSDDKHPNDLIHGHINQLAARAVNKGVDVFKVLQAACINPVEHYGLQVGTLQPEDPADFIIVDNLQHFNVLQTYINGVLVADKKESFIERKAIAPANNFNINPVKASDLIASSQNHSIPVIVVEDGQLMTGQTNYEVSDNTDIQPNTSEDILKITVVNRYNQTKPAVAFIKNFGLKSGAIASSVAHDSHNIIAVGCDDTSLAKAINLIIEAKGGISVADQDTEDILPLTIAGLMATEEGELVATAYERLDQRAKALGSQLSAPFMSLSFMALLVIPALKLSDKGLFDGEAFRFVKY